MTNSKKSGAESANSAPRTRRKRDSLNRENILEAAEAIVTRDGLDGLTFQSLGEELHAHPTSMYRHFKDKDELLLALIDSLRDRSYLGALVETGDWRDDLRLAARVVHEHYLRYPLLAQQMSTRTTRLAREFSNMEFVLRALLDAGFASEEALRNERVFGNFVRAMSSIEAAALALPEEVLHADELSWRIQFEQLDPESFPALTSIGRPPLHISDPGTFDTGLELLLDGMTAQLTAGGERK